MPTRAGIIHALSSHSSHFHVKLFPVNLMKKLILIIVLMIHGSASAQTWRADNGDGTFTNPLFYDKFSDPDLIRVGEDYYLTGTTMHSMPGLPVLHSRDLVNWKLLGYALDHLDLARGSGWKMERKPTARASCSAPGIQPAPGLAPK